MMAIERLLKGSPIVHVYDIRQALQIFQVRDT